MSTTIYCKPTNKGIHSFYMIVNNEEYYLFSQSYRKGVEQYFGRGVHISESMKHSKAHRDSAITRTMDKLPMYIKYIEKEYGIGVMNKTRKMNKTKAGVCTA